MKRFKALLLGAVLVLILTSCNNINSDISSDLEENSTEASSVDNNSDISVSHDAPTFDDIEESLLNTAIREAIFTENFGNYLPGEFQGVGYKIIETFEDDGVLSVYALSEYVEYGFQDGVFVNVSGTNPKVLMKFEQMESGNYELIFYTRLDLFSDLSEGEIEQLLEPLNKLEKSYAYTNEDLQEVRTQADEAAIVYLKSINRVADVGERESHKGKLLTDLVSNEDFIMKIIKEYSLYPEWTGTQERIENNIRYIYQTEYDEVSQQIIFSKIQFDTNEIVECQVVEVSDMLETDKNVSDETEQTQQVIVESISGSISRIDEDKIYDLAEEEVKIIADIIEKGIWNTEGTADCVNDCKLIIDERTYYYHSECGTFNDKENNQNLPVTDEDKESINVILAQYITLGLGLE